MDCVIIFYSARKTAYCERALKKSLSRLDMSRAEISFAINAADMGSRIISGFKSCNAVFVVGGLSVNGGSGTKEIISRALGTVDFDECKKLKNSSGEDGYVVRSGKQLLLLLPDSPEQIEEIMQGSAAAYIQFYTTN